MSGNNILLRSKLRNNKILAWIAEYDDFIAMSECEKLLDMELLQVSGILLVKGTDKYLSHRYLPLLESGRTFREIYTYVMCGKTLFEREYGKLVLKRSELEKLREIIYKANKTIPNLEDLNTEEFIKVENSFFLLYYLVARGVIINFNNDLDVSMEFRVNKTKQTIRTMFNETELELLVKVNESINNGVEIVGSRVFV